MSSKYKESHKEDSVTTKNVKPKRVPLSGDRSKLIVDNMDPDYYYRWILDTSHTGGRIHAAKAAGFEFANPDDHNVGDLSVYKTKDVGSIIRVPDGKSGESLYFMRQPMKYREEDLALKKQKVINVTDEAFRKEEGQYGKTTIGDKTYN